MGVHAISQVLPFPQVKPPTPGLAANVLVLASSNEELAREARGGVTLRAIETSERTGARLRRRREDLREVSERRRSEPRRPANDRSEGRGRTAPVEFGLHIAADPYPERVQHSTPFVAQVIGQAVARAGALPEADLNAGVAAYDGAAARTESYFGAHAPVEFRV
ncbi:MAG: hypothetical protein IH905_02990 [Proteobacteria bacterium]|nr:hypothetical protein [Pseudomonadota bacterium]